MESEPPVLREQTKTDKFFNLFICFYRFLTEKFFWPRNYAAYAETPSLYLKDREKQTSTHKMWHTGNFTGVILDWDRKEPYLMSKRRAERVVSTSGGVIIQIYPDPIWFSVAYFIFFWLLPLPFSAYFYFKKVLSGPIKRLNYSFLVECSKGANLQKERPLLRGAEIIQDHIHLFYDRSLNIEIFPPPSDFVVFVCGEERKVAGIGYAETRRDFADVVRLMLRSSVNAGEEVRIYYIPRKEPIKDSHGNPAQGFKNVLAKNSTK